MTATDELRTAAATLRERANAATPGPWERVEDNHGSYAAPAIESSVWSESAQTYVTEDVSMTDTGQGKWHANGDYIATVHPGVGLALAELLEAVDRAARMAGASAEAPARVVHPSGSTHHHPPDQRRCVMTLVDQAANVRVCKCASEPCVIKPLGHNGHCCLTEGPTVVCHHEDFIAAHLGSCSEPHPGLRETGAYCPDHHRPYIAADRVCDLCVLECTEGDE